MAEKRRLPSWILGASTANKVNKTIDLDENNDLTKEEVSVVTEFTKPNRKRVTRKKINEENSFLVKCETKRKKKECVEKDVTESGDYAEKRKRARAKTKIEEPESLRKKKNKVCDSDFDRSNENQASSCDEEDDDLTMEDILSIAKEFVENDKNDKSQQKPPERKSEPKTKSSYTCSSATKTSEFAPQDTKSSLQEEATNTVTLSDSLITGDPAQDMLDLFLGHLLKKPIVKEVRNPIKDVIIPQEIKNKKHDAVISDKPVIMTKKKSSLRDTVAMLLD